MAEPAVPLWQSLLAERERRSLRVAFFMRAAIGASGVVTVWYTASSLAERLASSALLLTLLLACLLMLRALRTARAVALAAAVGAILDCVVLVGLVWIWHLAYTAPTTPLMHLLGHNLTVVTLLLVMINGAALRPVYPAAVAGFGALLHIALAVMAPGDPCARWWNERNASSACGKTKSASCSKRACPRLPRSSAVSSQPGQGTTVRIRLPS